MVSNVRRALVERTMTTLRLTLGARTVQDCIEHRESLAQEIEDIIAPVAKTWGISVESILLKDLRFSEELQESLSSAAKQKRLGESKVIAAQAEGISLSKLLICQVQAAKLMREASDILNTPGMRSWKLDLNYSYSRDANSIPRNTRIHVQGCWYKGHLHA